MWQVARHACMRLIGKYQPHVLKVNCCSSRGKFRNVEKYYQYQLLMYRAYARMCDNKKKWSSEKRWGTLLGCSFLAPPTVSPVNSIDVSPCANVDTVFGLGNYHVVCLSAVGDTCTAMDDWVRNPQAETALSNILPCVDEQTTNLTLHQSKEVIRQVVNIVNKAISSIANSDHASQDDGYFYNQSGPLMPYLCSPYDTQLHDRQCEPEEVSFVNASVVRGEITLLGFFFI